MVIYRKYRPQKFSEVIGQDGVIRVLESEIKQGRISHAYLFTGPRGLGKTTVSRLMAKAVNCENRKEGESEPCNKCQSCLDIMSGRHFDLIELDAASQTGVDNVRENIIAYSRLTPTRGKYKVFIIDEVHMLSTSAFNALLKTLEEPPAYVIFILATTEIHKLPETIISRCQRFNFARVSLSEITERLKRIAKEEKIKIDEKILKVIASRSGGCVRDAESLFSQILALEDDNVVTSEEAELVMPSSQTEYLIEMLELLFKKDASEGVRKINQLIEEGIDLEQFVLEMIEFLRKLLLIKIDAIDKEFYWQYDDAMGKKIKELAEKSELSQLILAIEEFISAKTKVDYVEIPQLPVELAILKICE